MIMNTVTHNIQAALSRLFLALVLCIAVSACKDEFPLGEYGPIGDGTATVSATVSFEPFGSALDHSRAPGDAIKSIHTLYLFLYNPEEELVQMQKVADFEVNNDNNDRPDGESPYPGSGVSSAETDTPRATFDVKIPYGKYHIYVVANIDVEKEWEESQYATVEALLHQSVKWDGKNESGRGVNDQMFGYFSKDNRAEGLRSTSVVVINSPRPQIKAWIKRVASKVTVAFNSTRLRDNVYIYIKSVTIKDIPEESYIGIVNTPDPEDKDRTISSGLVDGQTFYFSKADASQTDYKANYRNWMEITNGDSIRGYRSDNAGYQHPVGIPVERRLEYEHDQNAPALYFYENVQPEGKEGTESDKRQDVSGENKEVSYPDGVDPGNDAWKDARKYGSYIEVDGYYVCQDSVQPGRGPIKYRFMLGKDTKTDYSAERNHHYKLTLTFNGYANDIDWHIDYDEEAKPGLEIPEEYYVSYMYNQGSTMPARATPKIGYKLVKLKAVIIKNEWRPHQAAENEYNSKAWRMQENKEGLYGGGELKDYKDDPECSNNCEYGFLSLRKTHTVTKVMHGGAGQQLISDLRNFYYNEYGNRLSKGMREYTDFPTEDTPKQGYTSYDKENGDYTTHLKTNKHNKEKDYVINIPLFTSAKTMDKWAVYTGANPFYSHHRYARVKYTAYYIKEGLSTSYEETPAADRYEETKYNDIYQSKRIDNPRGIWRRSNNLASFHVNLMYNVSPDEGSGFQSVESRGPWKAVIELDPDNIVRLTKGNQTAVGQGSSIVGLTDTQVDFTYTPNKATGTGATSGAIIRVYYHNNSCTHTILVRQGYGDIQFHPGGLFWSTFNVFDKNTLTKSPLSMGSMFRRHTNLDYPILEKNNKTYGFGVALAESDKLEIAGKGKVGWNDIPFIAHGSVPTDKAFGDFTIDGVKYRIPTQKEVEDEIVDNQDMNFAFGIVYGDAATGVLSDSKAYWFSDMDNDGVDDENMNHGVRGVVAYCLIHGHNLFFPIGSSGHSRRKSRLYKLGGDKKLTGTKGYGLLRYGSVDVRLGGDDGSFAATPDGWSNANDYRPMAYTIDEQRGGIYWMTNSGTVTSGSEPNRIAIDFNYGNYMVAELGTDDLYPYISYLNTGSRQSEAVLIKPVYKK